MDLEIDLNKTVDENASQYFELSKKAKKKFEGAKKALVESTKKLQELQKQENKFMEEEKQKQEKREIKREWYEKFHWFISSEGFLCIGGKDSTSNEIIIKKHLEKDDLVFHTEMAGSPFFLIKNGKNAKDETINETAQATAVYSKAWKLGHPAADVFYVNPDQVSQEAQSGEFIAKGSFMIYGKKNYLHPKMELAIGLVNEKIVGGPVSAVKKQTENYLIIINGEEKKSDLAKKIKHKLGAGDLDEIIQFLPAGESGFKKQK